MRERGRGKEGGCVFSGTGQPLNDLLQNIPWPKYPIIVKRVKSNELVIQWCTTARMNSYKFVYSPSIGTGLNAGIWRSGCWFRHWMVSSWMHLNWDSRIWTWGSCALIAEILQLLLVEPSHGNRSNNAPWIPFLALTIYFQKHRYMCATQDGCMESYFIWP